jgi:hypothetical protein
MTELYPIKAPERCHDCGDVANGSHTCEDTPKRNTPHVWKCWGCYDTTHTEFCSEVITLHRKDNLDMCLCCTNTDFAENSLLCKDCHTFARANPEAVHYEVCDAGCGRFGMFTATCQFCEAPESPGCIICGEPGFTDTFCSKRCKYRY